MARRLRWLCFVWLFVSVRLWCEPVDRNDLSIAQMFHKSWTARDGVPDSVRQLTQSSDGLLWLASATGLVRFDGVHFRRYPAAELGLLADNITSVYGAADGGLWVGYEFGGISNIKGGRVVNFPSLPGGTVYSIVEREGSVWAMMARGLFRFDGRTWTAMGPAQGYRIENNHSFTLDRFGNLWLFDLSTSMQVLNPGANRFVDSGLAPLNNPSFTQSGEGWASTGTLATDVGLLSFLKRGTDGRWHSHSAGFSHPMVTSLLDRHGDFWIGSPKEGLYRLPAKYAQHPGKVRVEWLDHFTTLDGLSGKGIYSVFEDREGGLWIITTGGIDYFRRVAFHSISLPEGAGGISMTAFRGQILSSFMSVDSSLYRIGETGLAPHGGPAEPHTVLYTGRDGCLWAGGDGHVYRSCGNDTQKLVFPGATEGAGLWTQSIAVTPSGDAWFSIYGQTPLHWHDGKWDRDVRLTTPPQRTPLTLFASSSGDVYFGYVHGILGRLSHNHLEQLLGYEQMRLGNLTAIAEKGDALWLGGSNGLVRLRDGHAQQIIASDGGSLRGITGIVQRDNGDLWLNTVNGAVEIAKSELDILQKDSMHPVQAKILNFLDGFPGAPEQTTPLGTLLAMPDGRLLFAARDKLAWLDPDHLMYNAIRPGVAIDQLLVEGRPVTLTNRVRLKTRPQEVSFDVAIGSLLIPERTRLRFQLRGLDDSWSDAGQERRITYHRLQPGSYTLNLQSTNDSGVASDITSFSFVVPPTFLQSWKFKVLCAMLAVAALWSALLLRVRYATDRVRRTFAERRAERERIAGDLHDEFFQSIQGVLLRFQAAVGSIPHDAPVRARFEEILDQSDQVMLEGRELVFELRTGSAALTNMATALAELGHELESAYNRSFELKVEGDVRKLAAIPGEELLKIVREALWNAFRHSQAKTITLVLRFEAKQLTVAVIDDGVGIDKAILEAGERQGHFGMPGMRERAKRIRGSVHVTSSPQSGTQILIEAPSGIIYEQVSRSVVWLRF